MIRCSGRFDCDQSNVTIYYSECEMLGVGVGGEGEQIFFVPFLVTRRWGGSGETGRVV